MIHCSAFQWYSALSATKDKLDACFIVLECRMFPKAQVNTFDSVSKCALLHSRTQPRLWVVTYPCHPVGCYKYLLPPSNIIWNKMLKFTICCSTGRARVDQEVLNRATDDSSVSQLFCTIMEKAPTPTMKTLLNGRWLDCDLALEHF